MNQPQEQNRPRQLSPLDRLLSRAGEALRVAGASTGRGRPVAPEAALSGREQQQSVELMRINHAGEVAAQGLYHGQALVARNAATRSQFLAAAAEERDHLEWCAARLDELGAKPSRLSPLWYAGSAAIGALAGLRNDATSLGFVAETERQVSAHLADHLQRLPAADTASRVIVTAMRNDEERHGEEALKAGGVPPPAPVKRLMHAVAAVMKFGAARL